MLRQALWSILIGGVISVALFVPYVIWQYRSFGAFSRRCAAGLTLLLIYATAVVAYTLFPLPTQLTAEYCAAHGRPVIIDPTAYFRAMPRELAGLSLLGILRSWVVMQMLLNVALFLPLGVFGKHFFGWSAGRTILTGLGVSLLVESTQYTGNWFLMPCAYRLADVNDLITNTLGTALGVLVGLLLPRLLADPAQLAKRRADARPVSRGRRWAGMLIDLWMMSTLIMLTWIAVMITMALVLGERQVDPDANRLIETVLIRSTVATVLIFGVIPSALARRGSFGQRATYLRPVAQPGGSRRWHPGIVRALCLLALLSNVLALQLLALAYLVSDVAWVARDPRGLSGVLTRHVFVDSRALAGAHVVESVPAAVAGELRNAR